jgi:hypothetical protein
MAQGLNKAPLCTNIEALFVEMDFLRATGPKKQIEWATGNPLLDSTRDNTPTSYSILAERICRAALNL